MKSTKRSPSALMLGRFWLLDSPRGNFLFNFMNGAIAIIANKVPNIEHVCINIANRMNIWWRIPHPSFVTRLEIALPITRRECSLAGPRVTRCARAPYTWGTGRESSHGGIT